jgi:hypothetical protein
MKRQDDESRTDFLACNSYTNDILTATVEVVNSNMYTIKVGRVWIQMSRKHLMETLADMDERRTYEKRLADLQLKVAFFKSGFSKDVTDPIVKETKDLSDDIDSYVEARGENLEDELEEPILDIRKDLFELGYQVCDGDDELFVDESLNRHD